VRLTYLSVIVLTFWERTHPGSQIFLTFFDFFAMSVNPKVGAYRKQFMIGMAFRSCAVYMLDETLRFA